MLIGHCRRALATFWIGLALSGAPVGAAQPQRSDVYADYESLIGAWDVIATDGGPVVAVERFSWGPGRSYLWFSAAVASAGGLAPHFEGLLVWNGVNRNLDMLLAIDLAGGRAQESGTFSTTAEGFVREIVATYSEGTRPIFSPGPVGPGGLRAVFRQVFERLGPGSMRTRLERRVGDRWIPTFPGSDNLVMTRRPASARDETTASPSRGGHNPA